MNKEKMLLEGLDTLGIHTDQITVNRLLQYMELLMEANKQMNLTAIVDPEEVIKKHFLDSLSAIPLLQHKEKPLKVIDIGTGGGLPGIPWAIVRSKDHITLLDSVGKKVRFLQAVVTQLGLTNVCCHHGRAEDLARDASQRECYDLAISRAVAPLPVLLEYMLPFVKPGGVCLAYKSKDYREELEAAKNAIKTLGGVLIETCEVQVPGLSAQRVVLVIEKKTATPRKYPRKAGTAQKTPL